MYVRGRAAIGFLMTLAVAAAAGAQTPDMVSSTVDSNGLTAAVGAPYGRAFNGESFQSDGLTSFNGYQYAAYWAQDAKPSGPDSYYISVARRKLPDGPWQTVALRDSTMRNGLNGKTKKPWDVHDVVSLGICPGDGTIHISYDHHNHPLRYRVSPPGAASTPQKTDWKPSLFGAEINKLDGTHPVTTVCYPAFTRTPRGDMLLTMRRGQSGDGAWWLYRYDAKTHAWDNGHQYDDGRNATYDGGKVPSHERCAYPNGWTFGPDGSLQLTYVYRENFGKDKGGSGSNHDIYYAASPDEGRTWKNDAGQIVSSIDGDGKTAPKQFSLATPGMRVVELSQYDSLMNEQTQAVDSAGRLHMMMWHLDPAKAHPPAKTWALDQCSYFHYWRAAAGDWRKTMIAGPVGTRARIAFDAKDDVYAVYATPRDPDNQGLYFDRGKLTVARATAAAEWKDWTVIAHNDGPFLGEPMIDVPRLKADGVLSILIQDSPTADGQATALRVFDLKTK